MEWRLNRFTAALSFVCTARALLLEKGEKGRAPGRQQQRAALDTAQRVGGPEAAQAEGRAERCEHDAR